MKKFLSLLLALTLVVSLCPLSVSAANDVITKVNITKTDIKADYVSNVGGYGSLSLEGELIFGIPHKVALIDKSGKLVFDYRETVSNFYYDPDSGIISLSGDNEGGIGSLFYSEEVLAKSYPIYYNQDGSVAFSLPFTGSTKYEAGPMRNGRAVVIESTGSGNNLRKSIYVVDKTGKKVITFSDAFMEPDSDGYLEQKKDIENFHDGLAMYSEYGKTDDGWWGCTKFGFMDTNGKLVLDLTDGGYETVHYFSDGLALASKPNGKWYGYIDKTGKEVITLEKPGSMASFSYGLAYVGVSTKTDDGKNMFKSSLIDKTGKTVLLTEYGLHYETGDGLYTVIEDSKGGLINIKGDVVVPLEYDYLSTYEYGVAYAIKDGYVYIITSDESAPTTPATTNFSDVPAKAWFAAPVAWAVEKGITNGTSKTTFSPDTTCNNSEILTFLWRACGKPSAPEASFSDVASGAWYADAANWAKSKGMVSGDKLSPTQPCTRASAVMFIWQAMGKPTASKAASFTDVPASADYAAAVAWAVEKGVTNGTGADTFSPGTICTRAQIVAFLQRAYA